MRFGRSPAEGEPQLVAELTNARDRLVQVQRAAEIELAAARAEVVKAQGAVDKFRVGLVREHADAWRGHAEDWRRRAAAAGDETTVVSVAVQGGLDGTRMEPRLQFTRNVLSDEADAADQRAEWLDGYLQRGDALQGDALAVLVGQLEPLPEAAETVAA
jgi:hypothetical protein